MLQQPQISVCLGTFLKAAKHRLIASRELKKYFFSRLFNDRFILKNSVNPGIQLLPTIPQFSIKFEI